MPYERFDKRDEGLLAEVLRAVTETVATRPKATLWVVTLITSAAVAITLSFIGFKTDRADLIDPDAEFHQRWRAYTESFGDESDIVVVVESSQPGNLPTVIESLGRRLEQEPAYFQSALYKLDTGKLPAAKRLQYLSPKQLQAGLNNIRRTQPLLEPSGRQMSAAQMYARWSAELDVVASQSNLKRYERTLEDADRYTIGLAHLLEHPGEFQSPWKPLVPGLADLPTARSGPTYFVNASGTIGFLKAKPAGESNGFEGATASIDRLRVLAKEVEAKHTGVRISLTGIPVLENDEMRRSRADMSRAAVVSFIGVGLLLVFGFRGMRHPLLALAMLAVGMAWAFGFTTLVVGHLNILSVSFAVILIGLGIDFAIHYLARYLELRREGVELIPALMQTSTGVGVGIVAAAITTAFAFFSATFTRFLGVAELGIIAGGGIILCAAATFFVLPALVALADKHIAVEKLPQPIGGSLLSGTTSRFARPVAILSILLIAAVASQMLAFRDGRLHVRVRYDDNLLNLQADGLESVDVQKRVFQNSEQSLLYAVSIASDAKQAREWKGKFASLPSVSRVEDLASALPTVDFEQNKPYIREIRDRLAHLSDRPPVPPQAEPAIVGQAIEQFYLRIRRLPQPQAKQLTARIDRFLNRFERIDVRRQRALLADYQTRTAAALHALAFDVSAAASLDPVRLDDLPAALRSRFISQDGRWLLQIYPKHDIWQAEPLAAFATDLRSVDPEVTGTPLQNLEAAKQIKSSYQNASMYALIVISLVLLVDFLRRDFTLLTLLAPLGVIAFTLMTLKTRRIEFDPLMLIITYAAMCLAIAAIFDFRNFRDALFAMLPPIGGGLMMFGLLGLLDVPLNPANLIALPLVLGIGVDDGVHVVHDYRSQAGSYRTSASTMNAIVLTSLTSMLGFGSLMIAAHRGLYTVGLVLVIGVGSCLFVSVVTLPALLTLVSKDAQQSADYSSKENDRDAAPIRKVA